MDKDNKFFTFIRENYDSEAEITIKGFITALIDFLQGIIDQLKK